MCTARGTLILCLRIIIKKLIIHIIGSVFKLSLVNDDSDESDRPKRKKSRSMWGDSDSEDSDNSWRQRKKK